MINWKCRPRNWSNSPRLRRELIEEPSTVKDDDSWPRTAAREAIIETSMLVNFLKIDRTDLLANHPGLPLHRRRCRSQRGDEILRGPSRKARGRVRRWPALPRRTRGGNYDLAELAAFAAMASIKIGDGERAAIAAAKTRGLPLAMDDERAWKRAGSGLSRQDMVSVMVSLIKAGVIDVAEADAIKADWESNHKFIKKHFSNFAELIP